MPARSCVVFDTSTLVGCCITQVGKPAQALAYALRHHVLVVSQDTMTELTEVVSRDKFDAWRPRVQRLAFLNALVMSSKLIQVTQTATDCRDPKDNKFLSLALSANASVIVSSDADLWVLHPYRGIAILKPFDFLLTTAPAA
jgi:uncharacterized protein